METENDVTVEMLETELFKLCSDYSVILHTEDEYECWIMPFNSAYYTQLVRGNSYSNALLNGILHMSQFKKSRKA